MENITHTEHASVHKVHEHETKSLSGPLSLLEGAWNFYIKHWKVLIGLSLAMFVVGLVVVLGGILLEVLLFALPILLPVKITIMVIIGLLLLGLLIYLGSLLYGAQVRFLVDQSDKKFIDRIRAVAPYFWGMVIIHILVAFVIFGGTLLFILPGIYLSMILHFALFIYFAEGKKGFDALTTSFNYARGNFWKLFWRVLALCVLVILAVLLISVTLSSNFANFIVNVLGAPLMLVYYWKMYEELKANHHVGKHEGSKASIVFKVLAVLGGAALVATVFFASFFLTQFSHELPGLMNEFERANEYRDMNQFPGNDGFSSPSEFEPYMDDSSNY